jgi:hypothetical protein
MARFAHLVAKTAVVDQMICYVALFNHAQPCPGSDEIHGVETLAKKSINLREL